MRSKLLFLIVSLAVVVFAGSVHANLFTNGSFEDGDFGVNQYPDFWTGWEPGGINTWIDSTGPDGPAHQGTKMMKMESTGARVMFYNTDCEDVLTEFGKTYFVGFWAKAGAGETSVTTALKLEWHDAPCVSGDAGSVIENIPGLDAGTSWIRHILPTTAPDAGHLLYRFVFNHYQEDGYLVDNLHFDDTPVEESLHPVRLPIPGDGAESVPSDTDVLSWQRDRFYEQDPNFSKVPFVELWWGTTGDVNDFWDIGVTKEMDIDDVNDFYLADGLTGPISLSPNNNYYWALKYEDPNAGEDLIARWGNPELQRGPIWSFDTINRPPVVDGGVHADRWLPAAGSVQVDLDASYTDDGLKAGGPVTFAWTETLSNGATAPSWPDGKTVEDPNVIFSTAGDYLLTLTVNDGDPCSDGSGDVLVRIFSNGDDRLRAHYKLDEAGGTVASDSAESHDGTTEDNPVWQPVGGQVDGAIELDGADSDADGYGDFVSVDDTGSDPNFESDTWENADLVDGMTVSAWMNLTNGWTKGWQAIVGKSNFSWELLRDANNDGVSFSVQGGIGGAISSADADVTSGWHQIAGVYDRNQVSIYIDGLLEGSVDAGRLDLEAERNFDYLGQLINDQDWQIQKSTGKVKIGQTNNLDTPASELSFEGLIDQVRIFDAAVPHRADHSGTPGIVEMYRADGGHVNCGNDYMGSDVNEDCYITLGDFALVALSWLECNDAANVDCD